MLSHRSPAATADSLATSIGSLSTGTGEIFGRVRMGLLDAVLRKTGALTRPVVVRSRGLDAGRSTVGPGRDDAGRG